LNRSRPPTTSADSGIVARTDRDCAAQSGPSDEDLLARAAAEPHRAGHDRQRPGDEGEDRADDQPVPDVPPAQLVGTREQAQHHEQADLRQPPDALDERPGRGAVRQLGVAEDEGGEVHRREPARVDPCGGAVGEHREREDDERVQA
jgi:hypothetical protein